MLPTKQKICNYHLITTLLVIQQKLLHFLRILIFMFMIILFLKLEVFIIINK